MTQLRPSWLLLGKLHIIVIHFPIALLIAAAVGELWSIWQGTRTTTPVVRFCVLLGAASAIVAAVLGWVHAANGYGVGAASTLALHRWLGTTAAAWAMGTALFSEWEEQQGKRSQWFRVWLITGALLVAATGHFGGLLVHGTNFFEGM
jgi:uncharacterized membrane protein